MGAPEKTRGHVGSGPVDFYVAPAETETPRLSVGTHGVSRKTSAE